MIVAFTKARADGYGCTYETREGVPGAVLTNSVEETRQAYEIAREASGDDRAAHSGPTFLVRKTWPSCCGCGSRRLLQRHVQLATQRIGDAAQRAARVTEVEGVGDMRDDASRRVHAPGEPSVRQPFLAHGAFDRDAGDARAGRFRVCDVGAMPPVG